MGVEKRERNVAVRVEKANGLVSRLNNDKYINAMGRKYEKREEWYE